MKENIFYFLWFALCWGLLHGQVPCHHSFCFTCASQCKASCAVYASRAFLRFLSSLRAKFFSNSVS